MIAAPEPPPAPTPAELPPQTASRAKRRRTEPNTARLRRPARQLGPQPPPASRRRIRPVESAEEKQRLETAIADRQRQVQDILAKAKAASYRMRKRPPSNAFRLSSIRPTPR